MVKRQRLYGLFEKQPDGTWKRVYESLKYPKERAIRLFQTALLDGAFNGPTRELRPLKGEYVTGT